MYIGVAIIFIIVLVLLAILSFILGKEYFKMWRNIDKIVSHLEYIHNEIEKTNEN